MEPFVFEHSDKNIPVADRKTYRKGLIESVGNLDNKMRWAAFFFLNPDKVPPAKNWFKFKSIKPAPPLKDLGHPDAIVAMKGFQDDLLKLTENIEFENSTNDFMKTLKADLTKINETKKVIVKADKTSNKYLMEPDKYKELLNKNIQSEYKKEDIENVKIVEAEHQDTVKDLGLEERVFKTTARSAFITVKDHKENFLNNTQSRLLNPTKPEIGKISKQILENVINVIRGKTKLNNWKNTDGVLTWFRNLKDKKKLSFIQFDICSFYPSITPELMMKALNWAEMYTVLSQEDKKVVMQSKKSYLYTGTTPWVKKGDQNFDIGMGAYDGAESCDLIGLFLLDQIANRIKDIDAGLYRDDGLAVAKSTPRNNEKLRQKIVSLMGEFGLKITSTANQKVVEFLDVKLDLENDCFGPFSKPNDKPIYVNSESNHPPAILKNIPLAVNRRLSKISSSKEIFEAAAPLFQNALKKAGYSHKLEFAEIIIEPKRKRTKKEIWFNPPYNMNVKTNVGRKFLRMVDKHFPRGSVLHPLFNRSKLKVGYRCMPNMRQKINNHNAKILNQNQEIQKCNCRDKAENAKLTK